MLKSSIQDPDPERGIDGSNKYLGFALPFRSRLINRQDFIVS
jgi:hypothetical protein